MAEDRTGALAAWRALPPESRRRAWAAAAKPAAIEDPELAAVVARYATAMRGQVPAAILVVALAALFAWLAVAGFLITHSRNGLGVVLAAVGVIAAGLGIGALQGRRARRAGALRGGQLGGLPDGEQAEQRERAEDHGGLDRGPVGPGGVRDSHPHQRPGDQATQVAGDRDAGHGEGEDQVEDDDRQHGGGAQP